MSSHSHLILTFSPSSPLYLLLSEEKLPPSLSSSVGPSCCPSSTSVSLSAACACVCVLVRCDVLDSKLVYSCVSLIRGSEVRSSWRHSTAWRSDAKLHPRDEPVGRRHQMRSRIPEPPTIRVSRMWAGATRVPTPHVFLDLHVFWILLQRRRRRKRISELDP